MPRPRSSRPGAMTVAEAGRRGGSKTSEAKATTSREHGKRGGRPRNKPAGAAP